MQLIRLALGQIHHYKNLQAKVCYNQEQLVDFLSLQSPGGDVELTIEVPDGKGYKEETVTVTLGENKYTEVRIPRTTVTVREAARMIIFWKTGENSEGGSGLQYGEGWN